jgi:hypothetical protein
MLAIQFVNTQDYKQGDNIYDFIAIDSTIVFTFVCVDKKMNVENFVNFFDGIHTVYTPPYKYNKQKAKVLKKTIKNINKEKPELILYCSILPRCRKIILCDDNGFMFIKNGKIFVYRVVEKDAFELNEFINNFFTMEQIQKLNHSFIPLIYRKGEELTKITGNTPKSEIGICSKSDK